MLNYLFNNFINFLINIPRMSELSLPGVKYVESERLKKRRVSKKKVIAIILAVIIIAGFVYQPLGRPFWYWFIFGLMHSQNPFIVIQYDVEYHKYINRPIDEPIAKNPKEVENLNLLKGKTEEQCLRVLEQKDVMEKINEWAKYKGGAYKLKKCYEIFGKTPIRNFKPVSGSIVDRMRILLFDKPLPVWRGDKILAVKFLVLDNYGYTPPYTPLFFDFLLLKPTYIEGYTYTYPPEKNSAWVQIVGYSCNVPVRGLIYVSYLRMGGANIWFAEVDYYYFEKGKIYTLPVPLADKLKDNYVIGIRVTNLKIQVLEIGYIKP